MQEVYLKEFRSSSVVIEYGANIRLSKDSSLIEKWNLVAEEYYLIVGRLIPDNNSDIIVREFLASSSNKKLVIVGDVPYQDDFASKIKATNNERVIFTGYVTDPDELAELYHHCFLYFHGHEFGGTNPTLLKALAYGCAILALDTPFTQEMLLGGKYGFFFNKNIGDLQKKISVLEENFSDVEGLRSISRERIKDYYNWDRITKLYIDLFEELI